MNYQKQCILGIILHGSVAITSQVKYLSSVTIEYVVGPTSPFLDYTTSGLVMMHGTFVAIAMTVEN
jgi:hypothetical protein